MDQLRKAQEAARSGLAPWPEQAVSNVEAFHLATEVDQANIRELRKIGRGMAAHRRGRDAPRAVASAAGAESGAEPRKRSRSFSPNGPWCVPRARPFAHAVSASMADVELWCRVCGASPRGR